MMGPEVLIDGASLKHNIDSLIAHTQSRALFPVVKANAYGHGIELIAEAIELNFNRQQVPMLCVARGSEAIALRRAGIKIPVLILSCFFDVQDVEQLKNVENIALVVNDIADLNYLQEHFDKSQIMLHLNFNTGMNRLGFRFDMLDTEWERLFKGLEILNQQGMRVEGVMTHFAQGEETVDVYTSLQLRRFEDCLNGFRTFCTAKHYPLNLKWIHVENSGALSQGMEVRLSAIGVNAARPGLHVWGIAANLKNSAKFGLKPVMSVRSPIRQIFWVPHGESVGYGCAFKCQRRTLVGSICLGYADGISRSFSRSSEGPESKIGFRIASVFVPILGRVSMDLCMVDLSDHPLADEFARRAEQGLELDFWAYWIGDGQSADDIAREMGTIPYEVLCAIAPRLPRRYRMQGLK